MSMIGVFPVFLLSYLYINVLKSLIQQCFGRVNTFGVHAGNGEPCIPDLRINHNYTKLSSSTISVLWEKMLSYT